MPASLRTLIDGMPLIPAYVIDFRFEILARNEAAAAVFGEGFGNGRMRNAAVMMFESPEIRTTHLDWHRRSPGRRRAICGPIWPGTGTTRSSRP